MIIQRYMFRKFEMKPTTDGVWVRFEDAERLEKIIKELVDVLRSIKTSSYYCNVCSASEYADATLREMEERNEIMVYPSSLP